MEFQEGGGAFEVALLFVAALGLDFAELVDGLLELAGEPLVVHAESGDQGNKGLGVRVLGKELRFELRDAVEAPGGVDEFLGELSFGSSCRLVFVEELAAVRLVGGGIFGSEDRGAAGRG